MAQDPALPRVIALMGPTAAGKTELAIALHQQLGADLISVDSTLVYRGMNIGTAKPSPQELALAPHQLIDIRDPSEPYSAADFVKGASEAIERSIAAGRTPVLVGGTMLYFKALLEGLSPMPASDPGVRAEIEALGQTLGWPALHAELAAVDPPAAARLHPNHSQRIARALEVFRVSGKPLSQWQAAGSQGLANQYRWQQVAVAPQDRSVLHQRIAERFQAMLSSGFLEEVQGLFERKDLHPELPSMRAVGYRQAWQYLAGELDYQQMQVAAVAATRQLAKRQLTWLRSWHDLSWVNTQNAQGQLLEFDEILNKVLNVLGETPI